MGAGDFMSLAVLVTGIVMSIRYVSDIYKRRLGVRERELELAAARLGASDNAAVATIAKLEERVRVLERIATDKSHDVATQIDALRHLPAGTKNQAELKEGEFQ